MCLCVTIDKINVCTLKKCHCTVWKQPIAIIVLSNPKWSLFPLCELFLSFKQQAVFLCPLSLHCITNSSMLLLDSGQIRLQRRDSCFTRIWWRPNLPAENTLSVSPYSVNLYNNILTICEEGVSWKNTSVYKIMKSKSINNAYFCLLVWL